MGGFAPYFCKKSGRSEHRCYNGRGDKNEKSPVSKGGFRGIFKRGDASGIQAAHGRGGPACPPLVSFPGSTLATRKREAKSLLEARHVGQAFQPAI